MTNIYAQHQLSPSSSKQKVNKCIVSLIVCLIALKNSILFCDHWFFVGTNTAGLPVNLWSSSSSSSPSFLVVLLVLGEYGLLLKPHPP